MSQVISSGKSETEVNGKKCEHHEEVTARGTSTEVPSLKLLLPFLRSWRKPGGPGSISTYILQHPDLLKQWEWEGNCTMRHPQFKFTKLAKHIVNGTFSLIIIIAKMSGWATPHLLITPSVPQAQIQAHNNPPPREQFGITPCLCMIEVSMTWHFSTMDKVQHHG